MKIKNTIFEGDGVSSVNELLTLKFPIKITYELVKLAKELKEKQEVYTDSKLAIFRKYGEEKDGMVEIKKGNQEKATKELNELLMFEEEYSLEKKVVLPSDTQLSAKQVMSLEDIIEI